MLLPSRKTVSSTLKPLSLSMRFQCSDYSMVFTHPPRTNAPWGLGRITSQDKLHNQNASDLAFEYRYDSTAGSGVVVFIIGG